MPKETQDPLVNVFGCFKCRQLAGELRRQYATKTVQGYEQCPLCGADLDYFWLNLKWMNFQESRPVSLKRAGELARLIGQGLFETVKPPKKKETRTWIVEVEEHDRWSGPKVIQKIPFKSEKAAKNKAAKINGRNTSPTVPEYYVTAQVLYPNP